MAVNKIDPKKIFASQAPSQDVPAEFNNYERGWDESRKNNGKPTIKQFNKLQQLTDEKILWMHQNGAALPFDETMEYVEGAVVVKDGELQQLKEGGVWSEYKSAVAGIQAFKTETEALANTKDGDEFWVESGDDEVVANSFVNVGGIAEPQNKSTPSSNAKWSDLNVILENGRSQRDRNRDSVSVLDYFTQAERIAYFANPETYAAQVPLQRAINSANGKDIDFLGLVFRTSGRLVFDAKNNFTLNNGEVKALASFPTTGANQVSVFKGCKRFEVHNFKFNGNRQERTTQEEPIHSVHIAECHGFFFVNTDIEDSVCDGLYISAADNYITENAPSSGMFINCNIKNSARNNLTVIIGKQLLFKNCKFTHANGISPQAGVDIESNNYGIINAIDDIIFDNCYIGHNKGWQASIVEFDSPKGIRFNGGTIVSDQGGSTGVNTGGIHIMNKDTELNGVTFRDFAASSGYCVRVSAVADAFAKVRDCWFIDNLGDGLIQTHSLSDGISIRNSRFLRNATVQGLSLSGKQHEILNDTFRDSKGITISATSIVTEIKGNKLYNTSSASTAAILCSAANAEITGNKMFDTIAARYIQAEGVGVIVDNNHLESSVSEPTKRAIRINGNVAKSAQNNTFVNLHTTAPLEIIGTAPFSAKMVGNSGGLVNNQTRFKTSASVTLPAVPANSQAFITTSVIGANLGMFCDVSFNLSTGGTQTWAEVTATNTVTIYRKNNTASDIASLAVTANIEIGTH